MADFSDFDLLSDSALDAIDWDAAINRLAPPDLDVGNVLCVVDERHIAMDGKHVAVDVALGKEALIDEPEMLVGNAAGVDGGDEQSADRAGRERGPAHIAVAVAPGDPGRRPDPAGKPDPAVAMVPGPRTIVVG